MRETLTYYLASENYSAWINPTTTSYGLFGGVGGVNFQQGVSTATMDRPRAHGSWVDASWNAGMLGTFKLANVGTLAQRKTTSDALQHLLYDALSEDEVTIYWNPSGSSPLDVTDIDSTTRQITGLRVVGNPVWGREQGSLQNVSFALQSERPYAEEASSTTYDTTALTSTGGGFAIPLVIPVTLIGSGGGTTAVANAGTCASYPIMQVYGPINAPVITIVSTGETLAFTGSIAAGDYWEIDLFDRTVTLNGGTSSMIGTLDLSESTWFGIEAVNGTTIMQLTGTGYTSDTKLRILMRATWT